MTPFLHLDYLYTPSTDVAADARYFTDVLGDLRSPRECSFGAFDGSGYP